MVDCILCYAATYLVEQMTDPTNDAGRLMLERVRGDARGSKQVGYTRMPRCSWLPDNSIRCIGSQPVLVRVAAGVK